MAVRMFGIGWPSGCSDADEGNNTCSSVEKRVHGVGKNSEASETPTDGELQASEQKVATECGEENAPNPSGTDRFTHDRRSAAPPALGAR
jgi:hypothetical protein